MAALAQPERSRLVTTFTSEDKNIGRVLFSPDGRTLAIAVGDDLVLWEVPSRQVRARLEVPGGLVPLGSFTFSPDGKTMATAGFGSQSRLWDLPTGKARVLQLPRKDITDRALSLALSPDGKTLALGDGKGTVRLWDVATGKESTTLRGEGLIAGLAFSPDSQTLAVAGGLVRGPAFGRLWLWDVADRRLRTTLKLKYVPLAPAFSPDGQTLALGQPETVQLRDPATGRLRASWKIGFHKEEALVFSPDGRVLGAGGGEMDLPGLSQGSGEVKFWDVNSQKELLTFRAHENFVHSMALSPDGKLLAVSTGKQSSPIKLWDVSAVTGRSPAAPVRPRPDPVPHKAVPAGNLTLAELERLWSDLAGADAPRAYKAIWALAGVPQQTVAFLAKQLRPVVRPALLDQTGQLLADLGSDAFAAREKATQQLEALGELVLPALQRALADRPSLEARQRIEQLLERQDKAALPPEQLRVLRAVEALEYIGSPEAWQVLETLAKGAPEARVTQEALLSLERLSKRTTAP